MMLADREVHEPIVIEAIGELMKPLLCCDLDSVLCEIHGPLLDKFNNDFGLTLGPEDHSEWNFEPMLEAHCADPKAYITECLTDEDFFVDLPVMLPTLRMLKKVRGHFRGLHIVTARRKVLEQVTRDWLDDNLVPYDRLVMTNNKAQYCRKEGAKYLIDDAPHQAEDCHSSGIGVFLIDMPYNRNVKERGGLWRVHNPLEIVPIMEDDLKRVGTA